MSANQRMESSGDIVIATLHPTEIQVTVMEDCGRKAFDTLDRFHFLEELVGKVSAR